MSSQLLDGWSQKGEGKDGGGLLGTHTRSQIRGHTSIPLLLSP